MITFKDYIQLFNNAVRFYPATEGKSWLQPQSFAVLDSVTTLQSPNLGKYICDKGKPFFYSRIWEQTRYNPSRLEYRTPLVVLYENAGDYKKLFTNKSETTYNFEICILDRHGAEDCKKVNCEEGKSRSIYEIYSDTEQMIYNIVSYISDCAVYTMLDGSEVLRNVQHNAYIDDGAVLNEAMTQAVRQDLKENNLIRAFHRVEAFINADYFGTKTTIRFTVRNCRDVEYIFRRVEGESPDKGCC